MSRYDSSLYSELYTFFIFFLSLSLNKAKLPLLLERFYNCKNLYWPFLKIFKVERDNWRGCEFFGVLRWVRGEEDLERDSMKVRKILKNQR